MKKKLLAAAIFSLFTFNIAQAQSDPIVMEVGGKQIRQSEFMKEFNQSVGDNLKKRHGVTSDEKRQALKEYTELYATFRAKVEDAKAQGFDTMPDMLRELARYRKDLAAPYLIDSTVLERLLHEAYDRNHYSLHAAHILVRVKPDASAEDTLAALQRARELRQRVVNGEDFYAVAAEEVHRISPKAQLRPNEGELGYFSVFDMVYPFENAAYALNVGEVSQPVRTRFGYHIIKLIDKVSMYGKCTMAHIWLKSNDSASNRGAINMMYNQLKDGQDFAMVARQSDDRSTANSGGLLSDATLSQLPPEYVSRLQNMKEGEFSKPFFTQYGWHIIKLIQKDTLPPYESMVPYYKSKMSRDPRGEESRKNFARICRQRYHIVDNTVTPVEQPKAPKGKKSKGKQQQPVQMKASLDELITIVPDSVMSGLWRYKDTSFKDLRPLVEMPNRTYNVLDVARYIRRHQKSERNRTTIPYYVRNKYDEFIDSVTIVYADNQLENEHADFAEVVDEYRRGLMIFNYNEKMIWGKAVNDSVGFAQYYARESSTKHLDNPADSLYFWKKRARLVILDVADSTMLAPNKAQKMLVKAAKKNMGSLEMKQMLSEKCKNINGDEPVSLDLQLVEYSRQNILQDNEWSKGVYLHPHGHGYRAIVVEDIIAPVIKSQREARGYYLNGYQNEVEENLNQTLRKKYNVKIHWDVVNKINY